jgi:hypothetical protein
MTVPLPRGTKEEELEQEQESHRRQRIRNSKELSEKFDFPISSFLTLTLSI